MEFENLRLHDATVTSIDYKWEDKSVSVVGERYDFISKKVLEFRILFTSVKLLTIPHAEDWGPSNSILETTKLNEAEYQIQMQSGDLIVINAESFAFD